MSVVFVPILYIMLTHVCLLLIKFGICVLQKIKLLKKLKNLIGMAFDDFIGHHAEPVWTSIYGPFLRTRYLRFEFCFI